MAIGQLREAAEYISDRGFTGVHTAVVLGTGLSRLLDFVKRLKVLAYQEIPHFPAATVESHRGQMVLAECGNKRVIIFQGRFHHYEGYTMQQVVFPVRVAKLLGVESLLLSNAAGALNPLYEKGDLVLIADHINLQTANPLTGKNIDELGTRFPDMSAPYDAAMQERLRRCAVERSTPLKEGVYVAVNGPNLETRAEYRFLKTIGGDMVGMSTVPEVIAAVHMGLPCAAVSVITDECDPDNLRPTSLAEIIAAANAADERLAPVFYDFLRK